MLLARLLSEDLGKTKVPLEAVCLLLRLDLVDKAVKDVLVKLVVAVKVVSDQAVLKLGCSSCSSVRWQAGSLKALC